jgi:hypothetical protein
MVLWQTQIDAKAMGLFQRAQIHLPIKIPPMMGVKMRTGLRKKRASEMEQPQRGKSFDLATR